MKKLLIFLVLICLPSFIYPKILYKFSDSISHKNNAVLSKIFLNVLGGRDYLKLIYLNRNEGKKFGIYEATSVDTVIHHDSLQAFYKLDSVYKTLINPNYIQLLDSAFHSMDISSQNDTIFMFTESCSEPIRDLIYYLSNNKPNHRQLLTLIYPINCKTEIIDTMTWEKEAMESVRDIISKTQKEHSRLLKPLSPIPDSLKTLYEIYNR